MESSPKPTVEKVAEVFQISTRNEKFGLWLDRQQRPTLVAAVNEGVGKSRHEVEQSIFSAIMEALTKKCKELIPTHLKNAYFTYSVGSWKRTKGEFLMKVHLTTEAFLDLTKKLCNSNSWELNPFNKECIKEELTKRERNDHRGEKLRQLFENPDCMINLHKESEYHIGYSSKLDYPVLCLYYGEKSTATPAAKLPDALRVLETFISKSWGQKGFSIGMVIESTDCSSFQVAAIVEEEVFAQKTKKNEAKVKESWGWAKPVRKYY